MPKESQIAMHDTQETVLKDEKREKNIKEDHRFEVVNVSTESKQRRYHMLRQGSFVAWLHVMVPELIIVKWIKKILFYVELRPADHSR